MKKIRYILFAATALIGATLLVFAVRNDFGLGRNMELMINMMRTISTYYVDDVNPDKLMTDAAAGMTRNLDPYTTYLSEEEMSDFDFLTTGKYGGVGSLIRKRGDYIVFAQPYKGSPADRAGLKIGDQIIAINGKSAKGFTTAEVSKQLKGNPGSSITITIESLYTGQQKEITLLRERIAIPGVPYAAYIADGIGYIQHDDFTEGCYEEMRASIEQLRHSGELKGLILDYRSNGGGILQEAVKILSLFVPKGTEVVSTKGRTESSKRSFRTTTEPILPNLPLVVLINGNTASAAEIVAGALQDLDRAVLIGQKSYGKGLVQTTRPLGYNAYIKLTTAKYYIPSGRCIQAIDYSSHKTDGGTKVADSLTRAVTTKGGRTVYDGGGITPDVKLEPQYVSRFAITLYAMGFIEDFVDSYMKKHYKEAINNATFSITDADYDAFVAFMADKKVPYESATRQLLHSMQEAAKSDHFTAVQEQISDLEKNLKDDKQANLQTYRREIIEAINSDIVLRHSYTQGVIEYNIPKDLDIRRAIELLTEPTAYRALLTPKTECETPSDPVTKPSK
ncbi:MAG: S41 family peptidase [Alistipes sp.]